MSVTAHGKVKRYWPGKAPEWADRVEEDADLRTTYRAAAVEKVLPSEDIGSVDDPRLRRLADIRGSDRDEARADHWWIRQAAIVSTEEEDVSAAEVAAMEKEEDLDAVEERRRRIREKAMESRRREEEEMELPTVEEEDEYETDFEEEEEYETEKPVFVRKQERETLVERERMEEAERAVEEAVKRRMAERKAETKQIVVEKIREEYETIIKSINNNNNEADDDDEVNEAEEYEACKAREIARIKKRNREEEDRDPMLKIKRVRKMTEHKEDERREWKRKKSKRAFMQKDYHKGAFFQDEPDEIYRRDFSAPTGEDKLNKTILPKVMQVKHFGRRGRTKWTHLVAEDTTHWTHTLRFT